MSLVFEYLFCKFSSPRALRLGVPLLNPRRDKRAVFHLKQSPGICAAAQIFNKMHRGKISAIHGLLKLQPAAARAGGTRRSSLFSSIPYTAIQSATSQRRMFHLVYLSLDGEETSLNFKLDSSQSASGLYRAITEKHAFYSCETVRSAVTAQFIRDLKVRLIDSDVGASRGACTERKN